MNAFFKKYSIASPEREVTLSITGSAARLLDRKKSNSEEPLFRGRLGLVTRCHYGPLGFQVHISMKNTGP